MSPAYRLSASHRSAYEIYTRTLPHIFWLPAETRLTGLVLLSLAVVMGARRWVKSLRRKRERRKEALKRSKGKGNATETASHQPSPWIAPPNNLPPPQSHPFFAALDLAPDRLPVSSSSPSTSHYADEELSSRADSSRESHPVASQPIASQSDHYPLPTFRRHDSGAGVSISYEDVPSMIPSEPIRKTYTRRVSSGDNERHQRMIHGELLQVGDRNNGWRRNIWVING